MMDAQYFIDKFEAIPEEEWTIYVQQSYDGRRCALGHLMPENAQSEDHYGHRTEEGIAIGKLFYAKATEKCLYLWQAEYPGQLMVSRINNGQDPEYRQFTPKQRILSALRDIQAEEQKKEQDEAIEQVVQIIQEGPKTPVLSPDPDEEEYQEWEEDELEDEETEVLVGVPLEL